VDQCEHLYPAAQFCDHSSDTRTRDVDNPRGRLPPIPVSPTPLVSVIDISDILTSRFYPNGQVLSLLANEEHTPQQIIPLLKPTLRMKVRIILCCKFLHLIQHYRASTSEAGTSPARQFALQTSSKQAAILPSLIPGTLHPSHPSLPLPTTNPMHPASQDPNGTRS
jgi:hypothetical protein